MTAVSPANENRVGRSLYFVQLLTKCSPIFDNSYDTSLGSRGQNGLQVVSFYKTKPCYTLVRYLVDIWFYH